MNGADIFPYPRNRLQEADLDLAASLQSLLQRQVMDKRLELKEDYVRLLEPCLGMLLAQVGLQRMFWPEACGGDGHSHPSASYTVVAALEQIARADVGLAFLAAHSLALQAALVHEGGEQVAAAAPLFCGTDRPLIVSFVLPALLEEEGAAEWRGKGLQVRAKPAAGEWVLEGRRVRPTCSGMDAGLFAVACAVEGEDRPAFILVPGDAPGLRRGEGVLKTGLAASRNADIDLDGVRVPAANCAWRGDEGFFKLLPWFYLGLAATAVGALLATYEIIREWGDNRVIKGRGQIFKNNPLTAAVMGEVAKETAIDRLLAYDLAGMLAEADTYGGVGSQALFTSTLMLAHEVMSSAEHTVGRAMELMASAGYAKEWQLERYWRDIKTVHCYLGAYELAKHDFARWYYRTDAL